MDADFWQQRWHNNETAFHQQSTNPYLQRFWPQIKPGKNVFVPLAGKSRDMLWLAERGHQVLGIELSAAAIAAFFQEAGLSPQVTKNKTFEIWETANIRLLCGDFFDLDRSYLAAIETVYDRASLIALPAMMRARYASRMLSLLTPAAPMLLITLEYDQLEMNGPPFAVFEQEVRSLYEEAYAISLLLDHDALDEAPRFRKKGLTWLKEKVYRLTPRINAS